MTDTDTVVIEKKQSRKPSEPEVEPTGVTVDINGLHDLSLNELLNRAGTMGLKVAGLRSKHHVIYELVKAHCRQGDAVEGLGVIESTNGQSGPIRWPKFSFRQNADDVFLASRLGRDLEFRDGNLMKVQIRPPRDREKGLSTEKVLAIEGQDPEVWVNPTDFDNLVAMFPSERLILDGQEAASSVRVIDLVAPLGKGQRGLIVAPPRGGKTILLKNIAVAIQKNNPETELVVLLLDERPEEVTDFKETVEAQVFSSTFDETPARHVEVADRVLARSKRLVEQGKDVVILLDSLTRLARAHNGISQSGGGGGRGKRRGRGGGGPIGSGGISPKALERSRRFFGSARNVEDGGSLTILATCLIETDSRMDDVIFEEFKGTGNMEITLDREMAESRIFPAIDVKKSGTRKDDLLYHPEEYQRICGLRRELAQRPAPEAMEVLLQEIGRTASNPELLLRGLP